MKISRFLILAGAAVAGTVVYKARVNFTAPGTASTPGQGLYAGLTGPGSLANTWQESTEAREQGRDPYSSGGGNNNSRYKGPDPKDDGKADDLTLIVAAAKGDASAVEKRLASGRSKVDSRDGLRRTPLMYASWNGYTDLCSRLLAAGANPEFRDREGNNAFDYAAGRGLVDELHYLLARTRMEDDRHYEEYAKLIQAAFAGDATLLPPGAGKLAPVNRINPEGQAPLHIAAGNGSVDLMEALIKRGADVNLANSSRQTPLHWAAWNNQTAAVTLLLRYGADITQQDLAGNTPLIFAAQNGSSDAVVLLLKQGSDRYIANKSGKTAAIMAEDSGYRDLAQLLK